MTKTAIGITKYIILGNFEALGYIDKPDLIGSFFGQTEGLIGEDLEFSELQKKGKLGRIEIKLKKTKGKTTGSFIIPTALNKIEVSLVAAAIESITKISHTNGKITIDKIYDDRKDRRDIIKKRAEELLNDLKKTLPESSDMTKEISNNSKMKSITRYAKNVFGGPNINDKNELILVEGVADVKNMLKHNINNILSFGGSNIPNFVKNISKDKKVIAFLDGDKAGLDELEELLDTTNISYYTFAPKGLEVEELNIKEINKCLNNKIKIENQKTNILSKIKNAINKNVPILEKKAIEVRDIVNKEIDEFQKDTLYKEKQSKDKKNINLYLKKNELKNIKTKINTLLKDKNKDFIILNSNLRNIKSGNLNDFQKIDKLNNSRYLLFKGVLMKSILNKSKQIGIKIIICDKKVSKLDNSDIVIRLFNEVLEKK